MLSIDLMTLFVVAVALFGMLGAMMLATWLQNRAERAVLCWAGAYLVAVPAMGLIAARGHIPDWISIVLANVLLIFVYGLFEMGVRLFVGRSARPEFLFVGVGLWVAACLYPPFYASFPARATLVGSIVTVQCVSAACLLWKGRASGPLPSRLFVFAIVVLSAVLQGLRVVLTHALLLPSVFESQGHGWMAFIGLQMLLQSVLLGHALITMVKERVEHHHRRSAELDSLTGAYNRRAFLDRAEKQLTSSGSRASLLIFDLDSFKSINDTHGHAAGDRVLTAFAEVVMGRCGEDDVFGRYGGEEFALLLGSTGFTAARRLAEEIRRDFASLALDHGDRTIHATVSVGLSAAALVGTSLETLIASADAGLYVAKGGGRNRVAVGAPVEASRALGGAA